MVFKKIKKAQIFSGLPLIAIIILVLWIISTFGLSFFVSKISSNKPILYVALGIGIIILIKSLKKK